MMLIVDSDQRSRSVTMDINDFLVVLLYCRSCYSWSVRMCSKFKDTVGCFDRCLFFFLETLLQKGMEHGSSKNKVWFHVCESLKKLNIETYFHYSVRLQLGLGSNRIHDRVT